MVWIRVLTFADRADQIIYPHSHAQMVVDQQTDRDLEEVLRKVKLEYLVDREGGWDTERTWKDVFSGGEKQRVNLARLFYHKSPFAVLDEATSAISSDVEAIIYETLKAEGISMTLFIFWNEDSFLALITISHRPTLLQFHNAVLRLGLGSEGYGWEFEKGDTGKAKLSLEREIKSLEEALERETEWRARHRELEELLTGQAG